MNFFCAPHSCRLQGASFYAGYFGPICAILAVDLFTFVRLFFIIARPRPGRQSQDVDDHVRSLKISVCLMVVLGLTWLPGILILAPAVSSVFVYLFTVTSSFQGFFIFLFYIAGRPEVRREWLGFTQRISPNDSFASIPTKNGKRRESATTMLSSPVLTGNKRTPAKKPTTCMAPLQSRSSIESGAFSASEWLKTACHTKVNMSVSSMPDDDNRIKDVVLFDNTGAPVICDDPTPPYMESSTNNKTRRQHNEAAENNEKRPTSSPV